MKKKYVYWQDDDMWLGYLEEYPDYWKQIFPKVSFGKICLISMKR
jgi:hypothetical protein